MDDLFLNSAYLIEMTPRERIPLAGVEDWNTVLDRWAHAASVSPETEGITGVWVRHQDND